MFLPDAILLFRAAVAAAVGFAIGWEREAHGSPAGDRTLALVAMGAAVLTGLSLHTFPENADRIIGGVITGVGFLGTGVIMRDRGGEVRGLTTAACIWTVAALGVVIGAGHYALALALAAIVLVILLWDNLTVTRVLGLVRRKGPKGSLPQAEIGSRQDASDEPGNRIP